MKPTASTFATLVAVLGLCRGVFLSGGPEVPDVTCPSSCAELFGRLEEGVQEVEVQLRGEPKSGTGTNGEWAWGGLAGACIYLQNLYGKRSCKVKTERKIQHQKIVFQPQFDENAPCDCDGVKRVEIGFSTQLKHTLPVDKKCTFSHRNNIANINDDVCRRRQGLRVEDGADLWRCVEEADCAFNDDRLQLAAMRDPRAVTVSSYFHRKRVHPDDEFEFDDSVDTYFQNMLGHVCMWTTVRHLLFTKVLADRSELFLFEDMLIDPVDWFGRFFPFVGLKLPVESVFDMAEIASGGSTMFGYYGHKGIDEHPGGHEPGGNRTFRDELGPESLAMMDDVVRLWLPPMLSNRFGVEP